MVEMKGENPSERDHEDGDRVVILTWVQGNNLWGLELDSSGSNMCSVAGYIVIGVEIRLCSSKHEECFNVCYKSYYFRSFILNQNGGLV
jgi:hypothetical protein